VVTRGSTVLGLGRATEWNVSFVGALRIEPDRSLLAPVKEMIAVVLLRLVRRWYWRGVGLVGYKQLEVILSSPVLNEQIPVLHRTLLLDYDSL
jgi:hypothetical protein